jgi:hypothetical protein
VDTQARLRLLEHAAAELLESETNGSMILGARGSSCAPLVVTALGCSVLVAVGPNTATLLPLLSLQRRGRSGTRALAAGCERTLRTVHGLSPNFVPSVSFDNPVNAARWLGRVG